PSWPLQLHDVAGPRDLLYQGLQLFAPGDDLVEMETPVLVVLEGHDPVVDVHLRRLQERLYLGRRGRTHRVPRERLALLARARRSRFLRWGRPLRGGRAGCRWGVLCGGA